MVVGRKRKETIGVVELAIDGEKTSQVVRVL